jgi:hypothetical protein
MVDITSYKKIWLSKDLKSYLNVEKANHQLTVQKKMYLTHNYMLQVIGRLELGAAKSTGSALHHWNEVCNSPRRQIAEWHKLRE